nr:hypothetical protein [Saccharothrix espanaensis]
MQRLGQAEPEQRTTILNVLCAYLRMPFPAVPGVLPDDASTAERERFDELVTARAQERQVRITAHRVLAHHRRRDQPEHFWAATTIDLTGATCTARTSAASTCAARTWRAPTSRRATCGASG